MTFFEYIERQKMLIRGRRAPENTQKESDRLFAELNAMCGLNTKERLQNSFELRPQTHIE